MNFANPYYSSPFTPNMNYQNPYMQQPMQQVVQPRQEQYQPQTFNKPMGLQGKSVDSIDVVKATDIPLDGSISYFPLADGTAIVTKQLQQDGTSKTIVYKPIDEKEIKKQTPDYITKEQFDEKMKQISNSDVKDELKILKRNIEDIKDDVDKIKNRREK